MPKGPREKVSRPKLFGLALHTPMNLWVIVWVIGKEKWRIRDWVLNVREVYMLGYDCIVYWVFDIWERGYQYVVVIRVSSLFYYFSPFYFSSSPYSQTSLAPLFLQPVAGCRRLCGNFPFLSPFPPPPLPPLLHFLCFFHLFREDQWLVFKQGILVCWTCVAIRHRHVICLPSFFFPPFPFSFYLLILFIVSFLGCGESLSGWSSCRPNLRIHKDNEYLKLNKVP